MSSYTILKASFQSGEISPFFGGQTGSEIYASGVRSMENVLPDSCGGFRKRNGTVYFPSPDSSKRTRLFEIFWEGESYLLAMNTATTELYRTDFSGVPTALCTITTHTDYSTFDIISEMKARVNKGVMYLVHHSCKPKTLTITESGGVYSMAFADMTFVTYNDDADRAADFSTAGNFPSCLAFKGGRLWFGATDNHPATVWASRTPEAGVDRYNDFTLYDCLFAVSTDSTVKPEKTYYTKSGSSYVKVQNPTGNPSTNPYYERYNYGLYASHAFELEENDMYGTSILWFAVQNRVLAGNRRAIFMDTGDVSSPETFDMTTALNTGSSPVQARTYKNYILFLGADGRKLYLLSWENDSQTFTPVEITRNASHLFKGGIKDFDIMDDPELIIWVVTNDGQLYSCSMTAGVGWAKHPRASGKYRGLAVAGDSHSRVFLEVEMDSSYHLEYLDIAGESGIFTDCSTLFNNGGTPAKKMLVAPPLEGHTVKMYADGAIWPDAVPEEESGDVYAIYLEPVDKGVIGLPIESMVELFSPEIPANGTSIGKKKRISSVTLRLLDSFGGSVSADGGTNTLLLSRRFGAYSYGEGVELVSEDMTVDIMGKITTTGRVQISHDYPVPFNVLSVGTKFEIGEV